MKVTEIKTNAGRTFNHPYESYSNLRCDVEMRATLDEGEDPVEATKALQAQCEVLAENHKQEMLMQIRGLAEQARRTQSRIALKNQIERAQTQLEELGPEEVQGKLFGYDITQEIDSDATDDGR